LRPCQTGFNQKVKAKVVSRLLPKNATIARIAHKHFETVAWVFTLITLISFVYTAYGAYNLAVYGTCDPTNPDSCIFTVDTGPGPCIEDDGTASLSGHSCVPCDCGDKELSCDAPEYAACEGDCNCVEGMCNS
jgi:hypothetical protein